MEWNWGRVGVEVLWFIRELFIRYFRVGIDFILIFSGIGGLLFFMRCVRQILALAIILHGGYLFSIVFPLLQVVREEVFLLIAFFRLIFSFFLLQLSVL